MHILNIATEPIKINISSQKASFTMHTTRPRIHIEAEAARLEISQPKGDLQIDSTAFRNSYGIKSQQSFCLDNAQEAKTIGLEDIGGIVEEGNRMAQIDSKADAVVELAIDSCFPPIGELTWAPLVKPEIHYKANPPQIRFVDGNFNLTLERGNVQNEFQPGKVNVNVAQYPSMRTWVSENKIDLML